MATCPYSGKPVKLYDVNYCDSDKEFAKDILSLDLEYRTIDGTGNNVEHPEYGAANRQLRRLCPSQYGDNISTLAGQNRPSARLISNLLFALAEEDEINFIEDKSSKGEKTAYLWIWGQFADHDLDLTRDNTGEEADIPVPTGDPFFDPESTGTQVLDFIRSAFDPDTGINTPRQQVTSITAFMDMSVIYGSSQERNDILREFEDGKLRESVCSLLPYATGGFDNANIPNGTALYAAGDIRANENVCLTSMQTLWVREHNYWAHIIKEVDHCLSDEEIYQNARVIVEAEAQVISFNEFLPTLFDDLTIPSYTGYDSEVDTTPANSFSTAIYRLHPLVSKDILRLAPSGCPYSKIKLRLKDAFFSSDLIPNNDGIDPILRGMAAVKSEKLQAKFIDDLRNFLFGEPGEGGSDLASKNLQRGRDHGLADFNSYRECLGLDKYADFSDIPTSVERQQILAGLYDTVDDIDLYVGFLIELENGITEDTLYFKITMGQFNNLRIGDRFWYENRLPSGLVDKINDTKLSDVISRNTGVKNLPTYVMKSCFNRVHE